MVQDMTSGLYKEVVLFRSGTSLYCYFFNA